MRLFTSTVVSTSRRRGTATFLCAITLTATSFAANGARNVVFFLSDDHGFADVGFRSETIETPIIDQLAAEGMILERYHGYPICTPSRVGLMTGRNPITVGITGNITEGEDGVPLDEHFLPEAFHDAGYQTWMCGKWHLGGTTSPAYLPHFRGFDHFYGFLSGSIHETNHVIPATGVLDWQRNGVPVPEDTGKLTTDLMADEAIQLIASRDPARPFFLYVAFHAVHTPYDAPQDLKDLYAAKGLNGNALQYAAMVSNMDRNIGRVLAELDRQGLRDETLVVFCSDNGADEGKGGSNLPLRGFKGDVYEGAHRVPAVIRFPGVLPAGVTCDQFISHVDWMPTLAAFTGIATGATKPLDGVDRSAALRANEAGRPDGFPIERAQGRAVLAGRFKIVRTVNNAPFSLYDVYADPFETTDIAASKPEVVNALSPLLAPCAGEILTHGMGCSSTNATQLQLGVLGCASSGKSLVVDFSNGAPFALAALIFGSAPAQVSVGEHCTLYVASIVPCPIITALDAQGARSIALTLPTIPALTTLHTQAFVVDPGVAIGLASTSGVTVSLSP